MVLPEVFSREETKNRKTDQTSWTLVLANNKPENQSGSENAISISKGSITLLAL